MIDLLYILVLVLSSLLLIVQELIIRSKDRTIKALVETLVKCEPIISAVTKAMEEAQKNPEGRATVELDK
jgi:hypothetical protein